MARPVAPPPIGACEDQHNEFKRAEALRKLEPISHAVTSMLNASGGNVWIGVIEQDERWTGVEAIASVEIEARRVEDHLMAAIEPSPQGDEVRVEPVEVAAGQSILVVRIKGGKRGPYAQLKGGGRHFALRVGGRSRPMTHSELVEAFARRADASDSLRERSEQAWADETWEAQKQGLRELWVRIAFDPPLGLPADRVTRDRLTEWLRDPLLTGNRSMGWNFTSPYEAFSPLSRRRKRGFKAGGPSEATWLEIFDDEVTFRAPLGRLEHGSSGEIYPYALVEFPVSVVRLAGVLYREFSSGSQGRVLIDTGLIGASGLRLRPGSPGSLSYEIHAAPLIEDDSIRTEPHQDDLASLLESPDALAWRALTALYFALGLMPDRMPLDVYDERLGKIHFPK